MFSQKLFLFCLFLVSFSFSKEFCGTERLIQNRLNPEKTFRTYTPLCAPEDYFDSVYTKTSPHFIFFYTKSGPHAVADSFLNALEISFENAYQTFTEKHKTLEPKGVSISFHYKKPVPETLYPVEILEISMTRNLNALTGECSGCFALTIPGEKKGTSSILIDNDFKYPKNNGEIRYTEKNCPYLLATESLKNEFHQYSYDEHFKEAINITAPHELYHAVQLRYLDYTTFHTYWLEASASGTEELFAGEVNDYFTFLPSFFDMNWNSFESISNSYSLSVLFLSMYQLFGNTFDTEIWESFQKAPEKPFEYHYRNVLEKKNLNADSIFHSFAETLLYAGKEKLPDSKNFYKDISLWPSLHIKNENKEISTNTFPYLAYRYTKELPEIPNGNVSFFIKGKTDSVFQKIDVYNDSLYRKNYSFIQYADTGILVYSRLDYSEEKSQPKKEKFIAYPNPWRGHTPLCFSGLDTTKNTLEIRTRKGSLVLKKNYSRSLFCLEASDVQEKFVPGLYFYRTGKNKMQKLIISTVRN